MSHEIERRFLIKNKEWINQATDETLIRQSYLSTSPEHTTRIRFETKQPPILCVKGKPIGITAEEIEQPIEHSFAKAMIRMYGAETLEKLRWRVPWEGLIFEIDEFHGKLDGLILAEIELPTEKTSFKKPSWLGKEVTKDPRYRNAMLIQYGIPDHT